ncbi:MAG: TonB-dependent receptor [Acidobacteria bacterium]|nr:TonB-dependent receptor [Acidobacteriota bacterium]
MLLLLLGVAGFAQQTGALKGQVTDESGALIPGAAVTVIGPAGFNRTVTAGADGTYSITALPPGKYTVRINLSGFSPYEKTGVEVAPGAAVQLAISLKVGLEKQEVTVTGEPGPQVSTEPDNNAGALTLRGEDLDALPDDPDDLAEDLQALAGPSAGPNGGQIFIDGFSGGRLPPKESIREIRINQNPFSAEYDKLGYGRIEILTKPGTDKYHGTAFFEFGDAMFNARNPYAANKPDFLQKQYGGNVSGPLSKRASFNMDFEKRDIDDNAIINATILDPNFNIVPFSQAVVTPNRRTSISPRIDYQLSQNNTLTGRYSYSRIGQDNAGIGEFSLTSRAYNTSDVQQRLQLTETAVLSPTVVNETRFQYLRSHVSQLGDNSIPTLNVLQSFNGGGAQMGQTYDNENHYEIQNFTSFSRKGHTIRFGGRLRTVSVDNISPQNFGGTFTFGGGQYVDPATGELTEITSIQRYQRTLMFQQQGLSTAQIRALGGGATQFSITAGNPATSLTQTDLGVYIQDDWRARPNLTISGGLRYETQTNIHDWTDFAPRLGIAWAPGGTGGKNGKTVIRGGFGMFYDRFDDSLVLQSLRFNGFQEQRYIVNNPDFYPQVPAVQSLNVQAVPQAITRVDSHLHAPYIMQSAIGIERQLPFNTTIASTFTNTHGLHMLRSRDINAPLPGTYSAASPNAAVRPYGPIGDIFLYESSGLLNQNQWMTNVNSRINSTTSIFAYYVLNYAHSNTDGAGTFPADQYNTALDYGRSSLDGRHRFVLGGSFVTPANLRFSPFVIVHSGMPFNITTGRDASGDTVFTDRPALATDLTKPGVAITPFGAFDPNPTPGEMLVPRNYGEGPGYVTLNLRLSRTFGFGPSRGEASGRPYGGGGSDHHHSHGGGGMSMGSGGMHSMFGGGSDKRYSLTVSISARNLLNHVNPGMPIGNLSSPLFGLSNALAGGFGPTSAAANRRLEIQLRFGF